MNVHEHMTAEVQQHKCSRSDLFVFLGFFFVYIIEFSLKKKKRLNIVDPSFVALLKHNSFNKDKMDHS